MKRCPTTNLIDLRDETFGTEAASSHPSVTPVTASSFMAAQQIRNVSVFSGRDCKVNVEDWIRDVQYMLDAAPRPVALQFSTIVRNLSGEARRLVLNIPPHNQTPEEAFEELRAEYSDLAYSGDPMADFYEREQRQHELIGSYAIALEGLLCSIEERVYGGIPVADRNAKLTHQFMRGLRDEEVRSRLAPMKPREMTFNELKDELRQISRERTSKRPGGRRPPQMQAHQATGSAAEPTSTVDPGMNQVLTLLHDIRGEQKTHLGRMTELERRMEALEAAPAPPPPNHRRGRRDGRLQHQGPSTLTCWNCNTAGHMAKNCPFPSHQALNY